MAVEIIESSAREAYNWVMDWEHFPELSEVTNDYVCKLNPPWELTRDRWLGILRAIQYLGSLN